MNGPNILFKVLLSVSILLTAAVLIVNTVDAVRMRDPDYARMVEDRRHYEQVISRKGITLHPALHWRVMGPDEKGKGDEGR